MKALVVEKKGELSLREIELDEQMGPDDVKIAIHTVGVCGSDVHYYEHGHIGPYVVKDPMVLGHEASGTVVDRGARVKHLNIGDRVCMEPGLPRLNSRATLEGIYNLDPDVVFWATPPVHGCLRPEVVFPAAFTFKLPDNVSFAEGALVEPLAIGMQAAKQGEITPGDTAVVLGAGPIGLMIAHSVRAGGCSRVIIADVVQDKLDAAAKMGPFEVVNSKESDLVQFVKDSTENWGVDRVFDASGNARAIQSALDMIAPAGKIVLVGCPMEEIPIDVIKLQGKEASIASVFRYANMYPRTIQQIASGAIDVKSMITDTFPFEQSVEAFEYAVKRNPSTIKIQIRVDETRE